MFNKLRIVTGSLGSGVAALNRFLKDDDRATVVALLRARYRVRMLGTFLEELLATPAQVRRRALLNLCASLLSEADQNSDCLSPHNILIRTLIREHAQNPWNFRWQIVDVRDWDYHYEFQHGELVPNDLLSAEQKAQHYQAAREWKMLFQRLRPYFRRAIPGARGTATQHLP